MKKLRLHILFLSLVLKTIAQNPIDINESTLKINGLGEEVYYCGLAEGDQLIFNFEEVKGKELKEVEIIEMPGASKFMDYKTSKIQNKTISINKTGIYKFRFSNSAILGRVCKFKVQRIPANDVTKNFNTSVYWKTVNDTTWTTEQEKYLVKADTTVQDLTNQVAKVHSGGNLNGNKNVINFTLPDNTASWSYYVGVDQAGNQALQDATAQLSKVAAPIIKRIPGYGPMAALALGAACYIAKIQSGEDIDYIVTDANNATLFNSGAACSAYKRGKVINDFSKMNAPLKGMCFICLSNDNAVTGVQVTVKVTAVCVNETWGTRPIQKFTVKSHDEPYLK